jgi:tetratricopeptide (TPR) repeat protein
MGRFCSLLTIIGTKIIGITIIGILVFSLPSRAQEPSSIDSPSQLRVPPPPENADPVELEQQGDQFRAQKAYLDSIDYYRAAMKTADSPILHNKVGMCLLQLRRDSEAKKEFQRAIKENKEYAEAYNNLGALYYNLRKYGAAIKEYKKAIKINDESASFHSNLGGAYFSQKDFDRASREYQRAIQIDPDIFQRQSSASAISIRLVGSNDLGHFHYVMAQMYGQHGDLEHCRFYLSKANEEGYSIKGALRDNEFAGLRKKPEFVAFLRSLKPPSGNN